MTGTSAQWFLLVGQQGTGGEEEPRGGFDSVDNMTVSIDVNFIFFCSKTKYATYIFTCGNY